MKKYVIRSISFFAAIVLLLTGIPCDFVVYAGSEEVQSDSAIVPEGYELTYCDDWANENPPLTENENGGSKRVLLIQDSLPWDSYANTIVLNGIGADYTVTTTSGFMNVNLADYGVVIIANDQTSSMYSNYAKFKEQLETFAEIGGVIVFGACDDGWADGSLVEYLPGDVRKDNYFDPNNYIADSSHPIVNGSLTDNVAITDDDLSSNYCSHTYFIESSLPAGSKIILRSEYNDAPTLVEYPLGNGRVIASGLTWEFSYDHSYGDFSRKAMADYFTYAIRVSSIDVEELEKLEDFRVESESHKIIVADAETESPIEGAVVNVMGKELVTDANGMAEYSGEMGTGLISVTCESYKKRSHYRSIEKGDFTCFWMEKEDGKDYPYVTMAAELNSQLDLLTQSMVVNVNEGGSLDLYLDGSWNGHGSGDYVVYYVDSENEHHTFRNDSGRFSFDFSNLYQDIEIYVMMQAADGQWSYNAQKLNVSVIGGAQVEPDKAESISLFSKIVGNIKNSDVSNLFPGEYKVEATPIPFTVEKEMDLQTGGYTLKYAIGIGRENLFDSESEWISFVDDIEKTMENIQKMDACRNLMKRYKGKVGKKIPQFAVTKEFTPSMQVLGFYEQVFDANGVLLEQKGGAVVEVKGEYTYTKHFLLGPVPVYIDIKPGVAVEGKLYVVNEISNLQGNLNVKPKFAVGGGAGVKKVLSVGAEGEIEINIAALPASDFNVQYTAKASIVISALWVFDYSYTIKKTSGYIWGDPNKVNKASPDAILGISDLSELTLDDFKLSSRDYNAKTTGWNGGASNGEKVLFASEDGSHETALQEWIMNNSIPKIATVGDKKVILYQANDASLNAADASVTMYSVYSNGAWSEPEALWDTDTADMFYTLAAENGELYAVWHKADAVNEKTDVADMMIEAAKNSEICYAVFDDAANKFVEQKYLTDNDLFDMYPALAVGSKQTAVWVTNSANDPLLESGDFSVYSKDYQNGSWSDNACAYQTLNPISEMISAYINGRHVIALVEQIEDKESLVLLVDGVKTTLLEEAEGISSLQFAGDDLYYFSEGATYYADIDTRNITELKPGYESNVIHSSFRVFDVNGTKAIAWIEAEDEQSYSVVASYNFNGEWTPASNLYTADEGIIQYMDATFDTDEGWNLIMNIKDSGDEEGKCSLVHVSKSVIPNIRLTSVAVYEEECSDGKQPINFNIENIGTTPVTSVKVKVYDENNTFVNTSSDVELLPGESGTITFDMDVSSITKLTALAVEATADGEIDVSDNSKEIDIGKTDLSADVVMYNVGTKTIVNVSVTNNSRISTSGTVTVIEDGKDGIVIDMKNVGEIAPKDTYVYSVSLDSSEIDFEDNAAKNYYVEVSTNDSEYNNANNSLWFSIRNPEEYTKYDLEVTNGSGSGKYVSDAQLTISANDAPVGKVFKKWESNGGFFADEYAETTVFTMPASNVTIYAVYEDAPPLAGDINSDGKISLLDSTVLRRYLAGWDGVTISESNADVNGDGEVTLLDSTLLRRYLAGWEDVELQ